MRRERPLESGSNQPCRVRSGVALSQPGLPVFFKIPLKVGVGYAIGAQPHMNESIALLQSARGELQAATPNKGGHRERAMGLIDQAIAEVRAGIAFAGG